jgi:O-antigen ligase
MAIQERPIAGWGLALKQINKADSELNGFSRGDYFAQNNIGFSADAWFLWLIVQFGIPGFLLYIATLVVPLSSGYRTLRRTADSQEKRLNAGLVAYFVTVIVGGISNSPTLVYSPSNLILWACAGLLLQTPRTVLRAPVQA